MITINHKSECCGCEACVQICPKNCINLTTDNEGYKYPKVNQNNCINCHLCEKACPYINNISQVNTRTPILTLAAKNKNLQIVEKSSSGGVFYELAKQTISIGGYVFGAIINDRYEVVHSYTNSLSGLNKMMGSKYVQSKIGNTFSVVENFLKEGKKCLFSGTPCQISGLLYFLKKKYDNLLTVDIVCHGIPSPGVWNKYISNILNQRKDNNINSESFLSINFRKKEGFSWSGYGFSIDKNDRQLITQPAPLNPYMRSFLTNNCLRPSCYQCIYKKNSQSDITLGDFWGIDKIVPKLYDEKGVSMVMLNTQKGIDAMPYDQFIIEKVDFLEAKKYNSAIDLSTQKPITRKRFFKLCANPKYTLSDVIKKIAPIESELSAKDRLLYLPTKIFRFLHRKLNFK